MAITLVGTAENSVAPATSLTVTLPTLAEDDVVYLFVTASAAGPPATTITTSGYTKLHDQTVSVSGSNGRFTVWRKVMGATPDSNVVISHTSGSSAPGAAVAVCLRGVDPTTPEDATLTAAGPTTSTTPDSPSITTVTDDAWVISAFGAGVSDTTVTAPSGYSNQVDRNSSFFAVNTVGAATKEIATAGAEDPASWTNLSSGNWSAVSVAVRPAVTDQPLTVSLYSDGDTFFAPTVSSTYGLTPTRYANKAQQWDGSKNTQYIRYTDDSLTATCHTTNSNYPSTLGLIGVSTGKYYWEVLQAASPGDVGIGLGNASSDLTTWLGADTNSIAYFSGGVWFEGVEYTTVEACVDDDVICFALDATARLLWIRVNGGNWNNSGTANPATGAGGIDISGITGTLYPGLSVRDAGDEVTANFGATSYAQSPPSGFENFPTNFHTHTLTATYDLQPGLYTDDDTFYAATVAPGAVNLAPDLYSDDDTFHEPTVTPGAVDLAPDLYVDDDTFHSPTITLDVTPDLYADGDTFFTPTVTLGSVDLDLQPDLYADDDTFHAATITLYLTPGLYEDGDTFYAPSVSLDVAPDLYVDDDTFHAATITAGPVDVAPDLYVDDDTFYVPTITLDVAPDLYEDGDTFYAAAVALDVAPDLYADDDTFHAATITLDVTPGLYSDDDTFYAPTVAPGAVDLAPDLYVDDDTFYAARVTRSDPWDGVTTEDEVWSATAEDSEVWTDSTIQSDSWSAATKEDDIWTDATIQSDTWQQG
jgi:hypothetical protein